MDEFIIQIFHVELFGSSPDITILIPISLLVSINTSYADIGSDVELSLLVEKGHYVLLDDVGARPPHFIYLILLD
jgi:hypothetical protein